MAGAPVRAPARGEGRARCPTRWSASAASRARRWSRSSRRSSSGATATSSSTRSARAPTAASMLGFHPPGNWRQVLDVREDILASHAIDELRERVRVWCEGEGLTAYDRETHAGFLRNLVVREGRRSGQLQARLVTSKGDFRASHFAEAADVRSVLWTHTANVAETTRDGETELLERRRLDRGAARRAPLPHLERRLLPDEHGDGRAAVRLRGRGGGPDRRGEGVRPLLRHRDDRPVAGAPTRARSGAWRSWRAPWPTPSRTPS